MRARVGSQVRVGVPAPVLWDYVTDWPRQGEWIPLTHVETVPSGSPADGVGGRIRAWTGVGPFGFWDPMTITAWESDVDGSARCEVLHTGRVLRGEGEFSVVADSPHRCTFVWRERLHVPGGRAGALLWRLAGGAVSRGIDVALRRLARRVERAAADG